MTTIIDARGLDCPQPVIKTKECVDKGCAELSVTVDNEIAAANVTRFHEGQGYSVSSRSDGTDFVIEGILADKGKEYIRKTDSYSLLFTSDKIGAASGGLGEVLMKSYLGTLVQRDIAPEAVALMNDAVMMAIGDSSSLDYLKELSDKGVKILVCGTCTKHFGVTEDIKVGVISNMFEITEAVFGAAKPIVLG